MWASELNLPGQQEEQPQEEQTVYIDQTKVPADISQFLAGNPTITHANPASNQGIDPFDPSTWFNDLNKRIGRSLLPSPTVVRKIC
jgi:hypothetical protein